MVKFSFCKIFEVKIVSETPIFVTRYDGKREKRVSKYSGYYETREEAKQAILSRLLAKRQMLLWQIKSVEIEFAKASAL
jgi:hypothetical protein